MLVFHAVEIDLDLVADLDLGLLARERELLERDAAFRFQADIDDGIKPGVTRDGAAELREARRRIRRLEQENEVLRRAAAYLSQANLPGK